MRGSRNPAGGLGARFGRDQFGSGETEVRGIWVLSPGETPDAQKEGVRFGQDWTSAEDGYSPVIQRNVM